MSKSFLYGLRTHIAEQEFKLKTLEISILMESDELEELEKAQKKSKFDIKNENTIVIKKIDIQIQKLQLEKALFELKNMKEELEEHIYGPREGTR